MKQVFLLMIKFYRVFLSPLKPPSCRYIPTCSEYALLAIEKYMEVDEEHIEVKMIKTKSQDNSEMVPALVANIPIKRMK